MLLHVHRDHKDYWGRGAQDGHLDFNTAPELWPNWTMMQNEVAIKQSGSNFTVIWTTRVVTEWSPVANPATKVRFFC